MAEPEIAEAAQRVADHALLLLAAGIVALGLAVALALGAIALVRRYRPALQLAWTVSANIARGFPALERVAARARRLTPSSAVLLHLVLGFVATAAVVGFLVIAEEVFAGREVAAFDHALADALRDSASPAWMDAFRTVTWFGNVGFMVAASLVVAAVLAYRRRFALAICWLLAQAGGAGLIVLLKMAFARSRPATPDAAMLESWSFPSGHALSTFVFSGMLAWLVLRAALPLTVKMVTAAAAFAWCLVIGFSRLYLGVHFLSDVVAGLVAAAAWVAVCIWGFELSLRRESKPPGGAPG